MRKRYTDKFRASAVVMLEAAGYEPGKNGGALEQVSKELKVPRSTLHGWFNASRNPPPSELRNEKKGELVEIIRAEIYGALNEAPNARPEATYQNLITGAAILIDKLQLLEGKPTNRSEIINQSSPRESILNDLTRIAARSGAGKDSEQIH